MRNESSTVMSVTPIESYFMYDSKCRPVLHKVTERPRRQEQGYYFRENGAMFLFLKQGFMECKNRISGNIKLYAMPKIRSFEIDTPEDLEIARKIGTDTDVSDKESFDYYWGE